MAEYRLSRDRANFALRRGLLRILLGLYLDQRPPDVRLHQQSAETRDAYAKPRLAVVPERCYLSFSISRSTNLIAYAISAGEEIGIDIEYINPRFPWYLVSREFLSAGELTALGHLPPNDQGPAFFRVWTRKEAFAKATGRGLTLPLTETEVSATTGHQARLMRLPKQNPSWSLVDVSPSRQYAGALVGRAGVTKVKIMGTIPPAVAQRGTAGRRRHTGQPG